MKILDVLHRAVCSSILGGLVGIVALVAILLTNLLISVTIPYWASLLMGICLSASLFLLDSWMVHNSDQKMPSKGGA